MTKLNKETNGFTIIEVLLVLVILATIGVAGYFVVKHVNKKPVTATQTPITQPAPANSVAPKPKASPTSVVISSSDGKVQLTLPVSWEVVNNPNNSQTIENLNNNPNCFTATDPNPCIYYTWFVPKAYSTTQVWFLAAEKTNQTPQQVINSIIGVPQAADILAQSSQPINGYAAYYIEYKSSNTNIYYAIADKGYVVLMTNGQLNDQSDPNTTLNSPSSTYITDWRNIVNSVKLNF